MLGPEPEGGIMACQATAAVRTSSGGAALDNKALPLTLEQEARLAELSQCNDSKIFHEFSSLVEELGRTDPERAFRIYVQWYALQDYMNHKGLLEGEALRSSFMEGLAECHQNNAGKHWKKRHLPAYVSAPLNSMGPNTLPPWLSSHTGPRRSQNSMDMVEPPAV